MTEPGQPDTELASEHGAETHLPEESLMAADFTFISQAPESNILPTTAEIEPSSAGAAPLTDDQAGVPLQESSGVEGETSEVRLKCTHHFET